ncbi:hypothetical protein [Pseudomonas paracarnis]|uniref:Uncharacterized protein n=1 Tax=Pseudomonas paracarnis TaxID=2750625 RepID=A0ABU6BX89_9PSED|nr:hypothetical protein [Pseudomonas paracarnis]MBW9246279.1 hypothetical protein [Pseudomonas paracarnis]MEB3784452.1 hypothetical protein [Pseudomonas paracarnis]
MNHVPTAPPPPGTPTETLGLTNYRQAMSGLLADIKWWLPLSATLISISLLTKYLWLIQHPELILSSLGNPSNLVAWLFFALLVLAALLLIVSVPSLAFMMCITQCSPGRELEKTLALRFFIIVGVGYVLLSLNLLGSTFDITVAPAYFFIFIAFAAAGGAWHVLNNEASLKAKVLELSPIPRKRWYRRGYRALRLGWLGVLLAFTSMSGVFPAQLGIMAWRGGENGWEARGAIALCLVIMFLYLAPVISFYLSEGTVLQRTGRAALALLVCVFANAVVLPAILDVWVYSAGNLIKIRDNTELSYVLDEKDYPQEVFKKNLWQLEAYGGPNGLYSVRAFRQFRFGDILLICPGRYRNISLKEIGSYAHLCITLSDAKVKVAAPVASKDIALLPKPECILTVHTPTHPPLLIKKTGTCLYRSFYR